jgi:hypothetical protein
VFIARLRKEASPIQYTYCHFDFNVSTTYSLMSRFAIDAPFAVSRSSVAKPTLCDIV